MLKTRVVVKTPFTLGDKGENLKYLKRVLHDSLDRGEAPISMLLLYSQLLENDGHIPIRLLVEVEWVWEQIARTLVIYDDYGISENMLRAIDRFRMKKRCILYRSIGKNTKK